MPSVLPLGAALLMLPLLGNVAAPRPFPELLRLQGQTCHPEAEGRIFRLQNATLRDRGHWISPPSGSAPALHVMWTPPTNNGARGGTMVGGWRVDVSPDLEELNGGDGPRVARANFDSDCPPLGTPDPSSCEDTMYCTSAGGAWREKCDGKYAISAIVLQQHYAVSECSACADQCQENSTGVLCGCCPDPGQGPGTFVAASPDVCEQQCPPGQTLKSPPCTFPPVCKNLSAQVTGMVVGVLFLGLSMLHSRGNVRSWVKDVPWSPERGEDSMVGGPPGLFRSWENSRAVRKLQQARASPDAQPAQPKQSGLSAGLLAGASAPGNAPAGPSAGAEEMSGWLTEAGLERRVFVQLRGNSLELWSGDAGDSGRAKLSEAADIRGSIITQQPAWRKVEEEAGYATRIREWFVRQLAGQGEQARREAAQRFAYGFTVELAQANSAGANLYVLCSNKSVGRWTEACIRAAGAGSQSSWAYVVESDDNNNIALAPFQRLEPVRVEIRGGGLHICSAEGAAQVHQLTDFTVEMVVSFVNTGTVRLLGCVLHLVLVWASPLICIWPVLLLVTDTTTGLEPVEAALWLVAGSLLGLIPAWSVMARADTVTTLVLVPRSIKAGASGMRSVVIRTASQQERDALMAAASAVSTAGTQGFSLAFLKKFILQNKGFMSQPGREYVKESVAAAEGRSRTGTVAVWDSSLVEVTMNITATTTNTTYELIKPMTEAMQTTYVEVAQAESDKLLESDVVELYGELFDEFDLDSDGYLSQTDWVAFLEAVGAQRGEGDISYEERDRQREFFELEKAAEMLDIKLNDDRISRSDFSLLYRLRDAKADYSMIKSRPGGAGAQVPHALYLDPENDVGPATVFVSHTWNRPFTELVDSLELEERRQVEKDGNHNAQNRSWPAGCASRSPRYWIDIFMKDQWAIQGNDTMAELVAAITGPGRVIVIGDGWDPIPICLTRVWCLFEILNTIQHQAVLSFAVFSGQYKQFQVRQMTNRQRKWLRTLDSFDLLEQPDRFDRGAAAFPKDCSQLPIDVRHADATVESDKEMIFKEIENSIGHDAVNAAVKEAISIARNSALAAEKTVRRKVWSEVLFQAVMMCFFWTLLVFLQDISADGHDSLTQVEPDEQDPFPAQCMLAALLIPISLGTLKTAHALVVAQRKAERGTEITHDTHAILRASVVRTSFSEPGSSHGTDAGATVDDGDVDVDRTPSGREALSQPNNPAIFASAT